MIYIHASYGNGYCGCDEDAFLAFEDENTDTDISDYVYDLAHDHAESFAYLAYGWGGDWESEEDEELYYENITCDWEEIDEEEWTANDGTMA